MIEVVDLKEIRDEARDLAGLRAILKWIIGQPFRFLRVSCGDELRLHPGESRESPQARRRGRAMGSYVLGARASSWTLVPGPTATLFAGDERSELAATDIRELERRDSIAPGTAVVAVHGFALRLAFADGSTFVISPRGHGPSDGGDASLADWELLTPRSRLLSVGPGERWSYLDSRSDAGEAAPPASSTTDKA